MSANIKTLTSQAAPWGKQAAWWLIVVEGGIALVLGLFVLFRPEQANVRFIQVLGGYLVVTNILALYRLVAHKDEVPGEPARWVKVGIGLVVGLIALFQPRISTIDIAAATTVLAIGILLLGILGLYGVFATRAQTGMRWGAVIANGLYLLFAFAVFAHNRGDAASSSNLVRWIGILSVGAGVALIFYGLRRRSAAAAALAAVAAAEAPVAAQAETAAGDQPSQGTAKEPAGDSPAPPNAPTNVSKNGVE